MRLSPIRPVCHCFHTSSAGRRVARGTAPAKQRYAGSGLSGAIRNAGWLLTLAACGLASLSPGCRGAAARVATAPVHGTVTLDGKPLPYGQVVFQPLSGRVAKGVIKDGQFTLGTYKAADGAVLGHHCVSVTARKTLEGEEPGAPGVPRFGPSLIPERYGNSAASGLEFEVTSGDNVFRIELSSRR